eukprot:IDg5631t1
MRSTQPVLSSPKQWRHSPFVQTHPSLSSDWSWSNNQILESLLFLTPRRCRLILGKTSYELKHRFLKRYDSRASSTAQLYEANMKHLRACGIYKGVLPTCQDL